MDRRADRRLAEGCIDYSVAWLLLTFLGVFGTPPIQHGQDHHRDYLPADRRPVFHRIIYDFWTLNGQIDERNRR